MSKYSKFTIFLSKKSEKIRVKNVIWPKYVVVMAITKIMETQLTHQKNVAKDK